MDKINPAMYVTDTDPVDEAVLNSSGWYDTEYCEETDKDSLPWLLAQGWRVWTTWTSTDENGEKTYKYKLTRRILKPERALGDLITSFTNAYNEGRRLNDQRYDEIVALFTVMVDKTEDSLNLLAAQDTSLDTVIQDLIANLTQNRADYEAAVDGIFDDYGDSQRDRINLQFDNQLTEARTTLIARGMYNTTVWDTISAGIERERAFALTDVEDKILEKQLGVEERLANVKTDITVKIMAARDRLRAQLQSQDVERLGLRNNVLNAMLAFMERRDDGYPDMASVAKLTATLGGGEASIHAP